MIKKVNRQGERNSNARLTEADIGLIRELAKTKTLREVAEQFLVTPSYIYKIKTGAAWSHVPKGKKGNA